MSETAPADPTAERNRPLVIVNPRARNGRVGNEWAEIRAMLEDEIGAFDFKLTEHGGHATELARQALRDGYRSIASLGGDGTHSQVVNGFFERGEPVAPGASLAVLPIGTGGDFRRMLPLEKKDFRGFARLLLEEPVPIDAAWLEYTREDGSTAEQAFINIGSFGVSGLVDVIVNRGSKALGGKLTFLVASVRALFQYQAPTVRITADGEALDPMPLSVAAVANGRYFGGGMMVAPNADLRDGKLDLVVIPWRGAWFHVFHDTQLYSGKHLNRPGVRALRVTELTAEADGDCWLDVDGEMPGKLPCRIRVLAGALKLHGLR